MNTVVSPARRTQVVFLFSVFCASLALWGCGTTGNPTPGAAGGNGSHRLVIDEDRHFRVNLEANADPMELASALGLNPHEQHTRPHNLQRLYIEQPPYLAVADAFRLTVRAEDAPRTARSCSLVGAFWRPPPTGGPVQG